MFLRISISTFLGTIYRIGHVKSSRMDTTTSTAMMEKKNCENRWCWTLTLRTVSTITEVSLMDNECMSAMIGDRPAKATSKE